MKMKEKLTASRVTKFLSCPRAHYYAYEIALKPTTESEALTFGSAFHAALEARAGGVSFADAFKLEDVATEADAKLYGLVGGYYAHWSGEADIVETMFAEVPFQIPISGSRTFDAAGKLDGLAALKDGRKAIVEHKTCGEDISPTSDYWLRLRYNVQLYMYIDAARKSGWDVETVIYDVIRKPSIRQTKSETVQEYAVRLLEDTKARPDFYFARVEVDVSAERQIEWEIQRDCICKALLHYKAAARNAAKPENGWPRNCNAINCRACAYAPICLNGISATPGNEPPVGYRWGDPHEELSNAPTAQ